MSSYRFVDNTKTPLLDNVAVSSTNVYTAGPVKVIDFESFCFQAEWTGTPTGTIAVLGSIDGTNFRDFGVSIPTNPAGSASGVIVPIYASCMKYLKLTYTNASSTGHITVTSLGKTR